MVDGPTIFEKVHLEIGRNLCRAITVGRMRPSSGMREKILGVEIKDGRQPDLAFPVGAADAVANPSEG
jgi:hypothetical protein